MKKLEIEWAEDKLEIADYITTALLVTTFLAALYGMIALAFQHPIFVVLPALVVHLCARATMRAGKAKRILPEAMDR